jgi:hypothetical protein
LVSCKGSAVLGIGEMQEMENKQKKTIAVLGIIDRKG